MTTEETQDILTLFERVCAIAEKYDAQITLNIQARQNSQLCGFCDQPITGGLRCSNCGAL